LSDSEGK